MGHQCQVAIVGGGPVGVALAVDLGTRGIACALVERRVDLPNIPKGQNLTQRTLEHFYFWGLIDEIRAARIMPPQSPIGEFVAYRNLLSPYWHATEGRSVVGKYYFQANDRMPQYQMEKVLRAKMAKLPNVESRFGWSATGLDETADGVRVKISREDGTEEQVIEAEYLIGCDGAHSLVRELAGIEREGTAFDQLMVLAVFRSRELHEALKRYPERSTYRVMHPDLKGYWQFFGRIDVGEGWFFHAPVPPDTTKDNFDFHAMLQRIAGFDFACTFDHVGFWDLRVAVAERYRAGRIFIAGDAAHSHPPYGGYGLNNGLEDIRNLSWKLAAKLTGWGGEALLDSYDAERRPVFKDVGENFIAARIQEDRAFYEQYDPDRDRAAFEAAWQARESEYSQRTHDYEPNYEGSPIVFGPPGGVTSAHGTHSFEARAGHHLPPLPLSTGHNVFEALGDGFTLIACDADDDAVAAIGAAASDRNIPLKIVRDSYHGGREAYGARLILVRPDQFIAWTGNAAPADAGALMGGVVGRAQSNLP